MCLLVLSFKRSFEQSPALLGRVHLDAAGLLANYLRSVEPAILRVVLVARPAIWRVTRRAEHASTTTASHAACSKDHLKNKSLKRHLCTRTRSENFKPPDDCLVGTPSQRGRLSQQPQQLHYRHKESFQRSNLGTVAHNFYALPGSKCRSITPRGLRIF